MMHVTITAENIDYVREDMSACDQAAELKVGCETWGIIYKGWQRGQMTIWPDSGRGAVCWGGNSSWGDWDAASRTLRLDDGCLSVDEFGGLVEAEE